MQVQNGGKREAGKVHLHAMVPIYPTMLLEAENEETCPIKNMKHL